MGDSFLLHMLLSPHYAVIFLLLTLLRRDGFLMLIAAERLQTQTLLAFAPVVRNVGHLHGGKLLRHFTGRLLLLTTSSSSHEFVLSIDDGHR